MCGCSTGGGNTTPVAATSTAPTTTTLSITIPRAASDAALTRAAAYISSSTQSVKVDIKPHGSGTSISGYPTTANLTATSAGCVSTVTSTVCNLVLKLAPNNYDATLTMYSGTGGSGSQLSAAQTMPLNVVEGQPNDVPIALGGIPASVKILAGGGSVAATDLVFTLPASMSGTLAAYGVDAAGNVILGAGAPTMSATTDNGTFVSVTQPTAAAPNSVGVSTLTTNAIAHVTVTATPVSGTGTGPVTNTVTVQVPTRSILYFASSGIHVYDATGRALATWSGSSPIVSLTYDSANQRIFGMVQSSPSSIIAYTKTGVAIPLNSGATVSGYGTAMAFDPANNRIYYSTTTSPAAAIDGDGNQIALSGAINANYAMIYDPIRNQIQTAAGAYNADGTSAGSTFFSSSTIALSYSPSSGYYYDGTVYPTSMVLYNSAGTALSNCSSFPLNGQTEQIVSVGADPQDGDFYVLTNYGNITGWDQNCNALGAPWSAPTGLGANTVLVTPP